MTNLRRWHRSRRKADAFDAGRNRPHRASGLVDDDLSLKAREAARTAKMSFIEHPILAARHIARGLRKH